MPTLNWIGKDAVVSHHHEVPFHLLKDVPSLACGDPGTGNLVLQADNLLGLKALLPYYAGKVKCIAIDPPYNTGNEDWIYNDNVNSPEIRQWLGQTVGKEGETLDRHDRWLCMMYPRLALLRQFLSEDGAGAIYGVATKRLNEQVKRNAGRFPEDLMFRLTAGEKREVVAKCDHLTKLKFSKSLPHAFTEHGAIMAATVLNSPEAVRMSVFVVRAFIRMREQLAANAEILRRLAEIDRTLLKHDSVLSALWKKLQPLLEPPDDQKGADSQKEIGFHVREERARYSVKRPCGPRK